MGIDMYIFAAHSKKELESDTYWANADLNTSDSWTTIGEKFYARKFWGLHEHVVATCFNHDYECGEYVQITRENLEEMITYAAHHPNYFDNFDSVAQLCELLYHWDELEEAGLHLYYECDW